MDDFTLHLPIPEDSLNTIIENIDEIDLPRIEDRDTLERN